VEALGARGKRFERGMGALEEVSRRFPRFLQAVKRGIGGLFLRGVFSCCFAQRSRGFFDVQNIVHDLKRQADIFAEAAQAFNVLAPPPAIAPETTEARMSAAVLER